MISDAQRQVAERLGLREPETPPLAERLGFVKPAPEGAPEETPPPQGSADGGARGSSAPVPVSLNEQIRKAHKRRTGVINYDDWRD